ncbi:unnamed protein product [Caenorhabditis brenneri]
MRILLVSLLFFIFFTPSQSVRFLFGSEIICDDPEYVFHFNISYWNGDNKISKERHLSARGSLFFYHEGAVEKMNGLDIHAKISHDCTEDESVMEEEYKFENVEKDKVVYRLDYTFKLNDEDYVDEHGSPMKVEHV